MPYFGKSGKNFFLLEKNPTSSFKKWEFWFKFLIGNRSKSGVLEKKKSKSPLVAGTFLKKKKKKKKRKRKKKKRKKKKEKRKGERGKREKEECGSLKNTSEAKCPDKPRSGVAKHFFLSS